MTNEDIEKAAQDAYDNIGPDFGETLTNTLRALALQVLEEAAQLAASHPENVSVGCGGGAECSDHIAADIRALKDLLAPPVVSSR